MRIVVIGAGVVGSLYAGRLAISGQNVSLLARGTRLTELQLCPLQLVDDAGKISTTVRVPVVPRLAPSDVYDIGIVMVRADEVEKLLPQLTSYHGVKTFLFMHNRAAGSAALADAVTPERLLLGFPGAGGCHDRDTIRYRLIPEQPTTLGEPNGTISQRLLDCAEMIKRAGFKVALSQHMDDWLKTHAVFVTAIAGAIYQAGGSAVELARQPDIVRRMVRGIQQGFHGLAAQGIVIEPRKLAFLFALPSPLPELYWRRYLADPAAELLFAEHARAATGEMSALVKELRPLLPPNLQKRSELEVLWGAVTKASSQKYSPINPQI
jgi:2-dehydropantoate 2-reductase